MLDKNKMFPLTGLITLLLLVWKWIGLFLKKNHLVRCWECLESLTLSLLLELPPRKTEHWFVLWTFFPSGSAVYVFHSIIWPYIGYFCHILAFTPNCYLGISDELQKWACGNASPSLTASLIPLAHCQNVARLILFYRYYFVRCYLNWLNWFHFLISVAGALNILISCMILLYYSQILEGYICQQFVCINS